MNETIATSSPVKRVDPPARAQDAFFHTAILNKSPERHYVLANPNDPYCGVDFMASRGYIVETVRKGGPFFPGVNASKEGTAITHLGQVLMSCPIEMHRAEYNRGQQVALERQRAITQPGGVDGVRSPANNRPAVWTNDPSETITRG